MTVLKYLIALLTGFLFFTSAVAESERFFVGLIPDSLKKNADAVVRYYHTTYKRTSVSDYEVEVKYAVTILNKKGSRKADIMIHYDRNCDISNLKISYYDAIGRQTKVKEKDIRDFVVNESFTLFSDNRAKYYSPPVLSLPCTIEYSYTKIHKGVVGFAPWIPQRGYSTSVQEASLKYITKPDIGIKHLDQNYDFNFEKELVNNDSVLSWSVSNLKAVKYQSWSPDLFDYMPCVLLSPNEIKYEGSSGSFTNWNTYGKWVYGLIEDTGEVPEEVVAEVKALIADVESDEEKVRIIYQYMQSKTRYVNIALGIGGFKPLEAEVVAEKGYGDCKALSNYTKSLLKAVGIKAYYAEIGAGSSRSIKYPDFASTNQTNHIIVCVPMAKDTMWLECTSQKYPAGYIGTGNINRKALLIKEDGGELVNTPNINRLDNQRSSCLSIDIHSDGSASYNANYNYYNYAYGEVFGLTLMSLKEQKEALYKRVNQQGITISDFEVKNMPTDNCFGSLKLSGTLSRVTTKVSDKLFIKPQYCFNSRSIKKVSKSRNVPIEVPFTMQYCDTLKMDLPEGYEFTFATDTVLLESNYGSYSLEAQHLDGKTLQLARVFKIYGGLYKKDEFEAINEFIKGVKKYDGRNYMAKSKE